MNPSNPPRPNFNTSPPPSSSGGGRADKMRRVTISRAIQPEAVRESTGRAPIEDEISTKRNRKSVVIALPQIQVSNQGNVGGGGGGGEGGGGIGGVDPRRAARSATLSVRPVTQGMGGQAWLGERSRRGTTRVDLMVVREGREDYLRAAPEEEKGGGGEGGRVRRTTIMLSKEEVAAVAKGGEGRVSKRKSKKLEDKMLDESKVVEDIEKEIDIGHVLGRGGFATVKMAIDVKTAEIVAVKTFNKWELKGETLVFLKREIKALNEISHPNIVRLHQVLFFGVLVVVFVVVVVVVVVVMVVELFVLFFVGGCGELFL